MEFKGSFYLNHLTVSDMKEIYTFFFYIYFWTSLYYMNAFNSGDVDGAQFTGVHKAFATT